MPTTRDVQWPTRRPARAALLVTTGMSFLGLTLYVVSLPTILTPLTDSVATSLGQIGLVFAMASLTGALGLTRRLSRMPLTRTCALLVGATSVALVVLIAVDAHHSVTGLLIFQVPFGLVLGSSAGLLPVVITDAYPAARRSHATAVLASVGGVAAVLGGLGADIVLRHISADAVILVAAICSLPLVATLLLAVPCADPIPASVRPDVTMRQTLTARKLRKFLLVAVLTALLIQPVRILAAPLCNEICGAAPTDSGRFVAAIAGGLALTGLVTRLMRGRLPHLTVIFAAAAVVFLLLSAGDGFGASPYLTVAVMGLLLVAGLIMGLVQSIVLEGIQRVGDTGQRVTAVAASAASTTAVAATSSWLWGVGFDALGVTSSLLLAAGGLVTAALLFVRNDHRRSTPLSAAPTMW